jgi:hypothetical protein
VTELYDADRIRAVIDAFEQTGLGPVEALLASHRLAREARQRFRSEAAAIKAAAGPEAAAEFARGELNDVIADLQDAVPPLVRIYNTLLRDPGDAPGE